MVNFAAVASQNGACKLNKMCHTVYRKDLVSKLKKQRESSRRNQIHFVASAF
jgi:hypothetical protein